VFFSVFLQFCCRCFSENPGNCKKKKKYGETTGKCSKFNVEYGTGKFGIEGVDVTEWHGNRVGREKHPITRGPAHIFVCSAIVYAPDKDDSPFVSVNTLLCLAQTALPQTQISVAS
jgi:hypothetical protein